MKVIHLISGGDSGGAKTHVHSLLQGLSRHIQADMVCFMDGPFTQEARALGISVQVISHRNPLRTLRELRARVAAEGYDIIFMARASVRKAKSPNNKLKAVSVPAYHEIEKEMKRLSSALGMLI